MAIVYRHIRLDKNEPFYIGIGKTNERANTTKGRNGLWRKIVKKTDYKVEILFDNLTWEEACEKEKEFIQLYGRKDLNTGILVNLTYGGEGTLGIIVNEKTKEKIGKSNSGRKQSQETINKRIEKVIGRKNTEETKEKMRKVKPEGFGEKVSKSLLGHKVSDVSREKMRQAAFGRKQSQETINKRIEKIRGKKHSEETKEKMREAWIKRKEKQLI
jgi:hypothetical protein